MTILELLATVNDPLITELIAERQPASHAAKFDNQPTWDNVGSTFDNRLTWDNWNKKIN